MKIPLFFIIGVCIFIIVWWIYKNVWNANIQLHEYITENHNILCTYKPPSSPPVTIIPKKLFQTWHSKELPPKMQETVKNIQKCNPELEYFLFDENDCIAFIKQYFSDDVLYAYNKLLPGAYKADLWRYCVMYIHGGVYLDIKYECIDGFKFVDIMDREHFVIERPYFWKPNTHGIYNALIIARPNNPIFFKCIQHIVRNTQVDYYGFNELYPTGPGLLGELYFGDINKGLNKIRDFQLFFNFVDNKDIVIYKNQVILRSYPEYRTEQKQTQVNKHYTVLWYQHSIYKT